MKQMKLSIFVLCTSFFSSALSFLPALFSIENFIKSPSCLPTHRLHRVCESLSDFARAVDHRHKIGDLHGSWRQLRPKDNGFTSYQTIDYAKQFALETTLFSNGTRVEGVMPFTTCGSDETAYFTHSKEFTTFSDNSRFARNITCSAKSFELVYASASLRVDRMISAGSDSDFRVFVPCNDVFLMM